VLAFPADRCRVASSSSRWGFSLSWVEVALGNFEVDYLAKVLRLKVAKGRRYEFTDSGAANGDRLFVFHRDVEKVRQRLKQGG
jgi:hypothetical protein